MTNRPASALELRTVLEQLAKELRLNNPNLTFIVDDNGVWLRHEQKDYGVYCTTINAKICQAMDFKTGITVVHRPTKTTKGAQ